VPRIDFTDAELTAVTVAVRGVIEGDRFPHAPRLVSLRTALAKFDDAAALDPAPNKTANLADLKPLLEIASAKTRNRTERERSQLRFTPANERSYFHVSSLPASAHSSRAISSIEPWPANS
jgi:hypothetical protein